LSIDDIILNEEGLIQIKGGDAPPISCGEGCGLGCGAGCGVGCSGCAEKISIDFC
jgi:hypothetical protein